MVRKKHFQGFSNKVLILALSGIFLSTLFSSPSWSMDEDYFQKTPSVILSHIFSFSPVEDLGKVARVSKSVKKAAEHDICWRNRIPGVNSKAEFKAFVAPTVTIYNATPASIIYETSFVCSAHPATSPITRPVNISLRVELKENKETVISLRPAVKLGKVYGTTTLPGGAFFASNHPTSGLMADMFSSGDGTTTIFNVMRPNSKFILFNMESPFPRPAFIEFDKKQLSEYNKLINK